MSRLDPENVGCRMAGAAACDAMACDLQHYLDHENGTHWRSPEHYLANVHVGPLAERYPGRREPWKVRPVPPSRIARVKRMPLGDVAAFLQGRP